MWATVTRAQRGVGVVVEITGFVEDGYGAIADAFRANWELGEEVGAGFSLVHDGKLVVDLTGGTADDSGRAYDAETLQLVFSSTKGVAAICLAMLVQSGRLDYEAPVSSIWPEFGAAGKADLPISWAISHRAGLASVDNPPPLEEVLAVTPIVEAIAAQVPLWELDGSHGYHAITYGWITAEILRRVTGIRMNDWLQTNVVEPLGVEFHMGLPESEHARVAPIRNSSSSIDPERFALMMSLIGPGTMGGRALSLDGRFSFAGENTFNRGDVWSSEIPGAAGITNARSLAMIYAATVGEVDGVRLLDDATRELATTPVTSGPDKSLVMETKFGMGFMLPDGVVPFAGPRSFGHPGAGGSLGYADPDLGIGYGYVMNQMASGLLGDLRTTRLTEAVVACVS